MVQPSASKTTLLLKCQWAFGSEIEIEPETEVAEAPRYGSAFHSLMEVAPLSPSQSWNTLVGFSTLVDQVAEKWDLSKTVAAELAGHVRGSLPVLQKWLAGKNQFGIVFDVTTLRREVSFAVKPKQTVTDSWDIREIRSPREKDHFYEDLKKHEIAATADLWDDDCGQPAFGFVMDHKTGSQDDNFAKPTKNMQLRTLALTTGHVKSNIVAIFHADRRGLPVIYADELDERDLRSHARRLRRVLRRTNSGYMRPGSDDRPPNWCKHCPAKSICPTQTAELLQGAAALVEGGSAALALSSRSTALTTPEQLGDMHLFFAEFDRLKEKVKPLIKIRIKALLDEGEIVTRRDGKQFKVVRKTVERLSKGRIIEALGAPEAERLFARLRKAGALEAVESEELWAVFPD